MVDWLYRRAPACSAPPSQRQTDVAIRGASHARCVPRCGFNCVTRPRPDRRPASPYMMRRQFCWGSPQAFNTTVPCPHAIALGLLSQHEGRGAVASRSLPDGHTSRPHDGAPAGVSITPGVPAAAMDKRPSQWVVSSLYPSEGAVISSTHPVCHSRAVPLHPPKPPPHITGV